MCRRSSKLAGIWLVLSLGFIIGTRMPAVEAQRRSSWSPPTHISQGIAEESGGSARVSYPIIVADEWGGVHAFWVAVFQEGATLGDTLYYSVWDGTFWSAPLDVLYTPGKPIWIPKVAIDSEGWFHLVWTDNPTGQLWYSRAHITEARSVAAWEAHKTSIGGPASGASVVVDADGAVHLIYCQSGDYQGVYHTSSSDGQKWSAPTFVGQASNAPQKFLECRLGQSIDGRGRIHAVWGQALIQDTPIYYSRSEDGGASWLSPLEVDRTDERYKDVYTPGRPNILATGLDAVHLVWFGAPYGQRWHRWSADGGDTWSPAEQLSPILRGFMEPPALAIDSSGTLHLVSMGWLETEEHPFGPFHAYWRDGQWSPPILVPGHAMQAASPSEDGGGEFAALAVAEGNMLHLVWELGFTEIWASSLKTDSPAVLPRLTPIPKPDSAAGVTGSATTVPAHTAGPATTTTTGPASPVSIDSPHDSKASGAQVLLIGVLPALLLVGLTSVVHWMRRRK